MYKIYIKHMELYRCIDILVKAPLRVLYEKYSTRSGVEWQIHLPRDPTPSAVFSRTARVYGAFTDLLVLCGRIIGVIQCNSL